MVFKTIIGYVPKAKALNQCLRVIAVVSDFMRSVGLSHGRTASQCMTHNNPKEK